MPDGIKECCKNPENLDRYENKENPGLYKLKCRVCGCNHYHLRVDPTALKFTGDKIGE